MEGLVGDDPPFHAPVFVLTHHPRDPQPMDGGTTYHFVTDGIESALAQAREAAGDGAVSIQGGASTINQYLAAGLIDDLRLHIVPLTLGAGTRLFDRVPPLNLEQVDSRAASSVTHVTYRVRSEPEGRCCTRVTPCCQQTRRQARPSGAGHWNADIPRL